MLVDKRHCLHCHPDMLNRVPLFDDEHTTEIMIETVRTDEKRHELRIEHEIDYGYGSNYFYKTIPIQFCPACGRSFESN